MPDSANDVNAAPNIVGNLLLWGDVYGSSFFAVDRFSAHEVWRLPTPSGSVGVGSAPVHRNGRVYAASQGGVHAAILITGQPVWAREDLAALGGTDLVVCGNGLLLQNLRVQLLRMSDGSRRAGVLEGDDGINFPTSSYAVSGNRAFVMGNTAAYGLSCNE